MLVVDALFLASLEAFVPVWYKLPGDAVVWVCVLFPLTCVLLRRYPKIRIPPFLEASLHVCIGFVGLFGERDDESLIALWTMLAVAALTTSTRSSYLRTVPGLLALLTLAQNLWPLLLSLQTVSASGE